MNSTNTVTFVAAATAEPPGLAEEVAALRAALQDLDASWTARLQQAGLWNRYRSQQEQEDSADVRAAVDGVNALQRRLDDLTKQWTKYAANVTEIRNQFLLDSGRIPTLERRVVEQADQFTFQAAHGESVLKRVVTLELSLRQLKDQLLNLGRSLQNLKDRLDQSALPAVPAPAAKPPAPGKAAPARARKKKAAPRKPARKESA